MVGALNTCVGLTVIVGLDLGLHVNSQLANAAGYATAVGIGFSLNRNFVFRDDGHLGRAGAKYLAAVGLAFAVNQLVLAAALHLCSGMSLGRLAAQLAGMVSYTALFFFICRTWVFRASVLVAEN